MSFTLSRRRVIRPFKMYLSGNQNDAECMYSGMNGIIAMKRFTCCEARICRQCQAALGPIGPCTGKAGWNHDSITYKCLWRCED